MGKIKRTIGILILLLIIPIMAGVISASTFPDYYLAFMDGFKAGLVIDGILIVLGSIIALAMWLIQQ